MSNFIKFAGVLINYIIDTIQVNKPQNHNITDFVGQDGSDVTPISSGSRVITFKSLCLADEKETSGNGLRIKEYINLSKKYNKKKAKLESTSKSNITGYYMITNFKYTENTVGNFEIEWEFTEVTKFNKTKKTFKVWNKAQALSKAKKNTKNKLSGGTNLNSNTKKLLKNCPLMNTKTKKGNCVKCLQIFLQSQGYYKNYKLDGEYGKYTKQAVQSLQKKNKIKATGEWDKNTRNHFQKKYKYPT